MKRSLVVLFSVFCLVQGCGGDDGTTTYRDFLNADGTVFLNNGKTPAASVAVTDYNWVVTFTDGSTVSNPFTPSATTDVNGKFNWGSDQLQLVSGNLEQTCDEVCVGWATGYEDYCTDWETSCSDYCADWEVDAFGNDYCASWATTCDDYCANWVTDSYTYCDTYVQDCGYIYPSRSLADITSAYSEITYQNGTSTTTTQSDNTSLPATSVQKKSTPNGKDTIVTDTWVEKDTYTSVLPTASAVKLAKSTSTPLRATLTTQHNAAKYPPRVMKRSGTPSFGRTHAPSQRFKAAQLGSAQKATLDGIRAKCGAYPKQ